jgi:hypothetical protein
MLVKGIVLKVNCTPRENKMREERINILPYEVTKRVRVEDVRPKSCLLVSLDTSVKML